MITLPRSIGLFAPLVEYPGPDFAPAVAAAIAHFSVEDPEVASRLGELAGALARVGRERLEELYADTFELAAERSLYVGHHLFGEDLRRNVLLTRLKEACARAGVDCAGELPDHLGPVLRLAAIELPGDDAEELLGDCLLPVARRLARAISNEAAAPYRALFQALVRALERQLEAEKPTCPSSSSSPSPTSR